jgi:hypothetical protein
MMITHAIPHPTLMIILNKTINFHSHFSFLLVIITQHSLVYLVINIPHFSFLIPHFSFLIFKAVLTGAGR